MNYDELFGKYIIKEFRHKHNYPLAFNYEVISFVHIGRLLMQILHMQGHYTFLCENLPIHGLHSWSGKGVTQPKVPRKDLQNTINASTRVKVGDYDLNTTIAYFVAKSEHNPRLYFEYTLDDENRLSNLFWTDYVARHDYQCFSDVFTFDAIYKTNAYKKPLVTLVGINHHYKTMVFSFVLLADVTVDSYTWLLQTFLSIITNQKPVFVIIDNDKAMLKATKIMFTECIHHLYCWLLERNA